MASKKHALVVDDSKSARLVLSRMLEKHGMLVDAVESATLAIDFLASHRPDVIFMDHMMPGMDGFAAVKAIKDNPNTVTIPIMMYTSKGGDLYLGQARALGAVGILPKTVAPAELFDSLERLGLVEERRKPQTDQDPDAAFDIASERRKDIRKRTYHPESFLESGAPPALGPDELDVHIRKLLAEQRAELRKDILLSLESAVRQANGKTQHDIDEKLDTLNTQSTEQDSPPTGSWLPNLLLILLLTASIGWNYSMHNEQQLTDISGASHFIKSATAPLKKTVQKLESKQQLYQEKLIGSWHAMNWLLGQSSIQYPWNELALSGQRMEWIEQLLIYLDSAGFVGSVVVETHVGTFCLQQDAGLQLVPSPPDTPIEQCNYINNPVQPPGATTGRQSLEFANFISSTPLLQEDGPIKLEISTTIREIPLFAYPDDAKLVGEWNAVAEKNNRVVVRLEPETGNQSSDSFLE